MLYISYALVIVNGSLRHLLLMPNRFTIAGFLEYCKTFIGHPPKFYFIYDPNVLYASSITYYVSLFIPFWALNGIIAGLSSRNLLNVIVSSVLQVLLYPSLLFLDFHSEEALFISLGLLINIFSGIITLIYKE